MSQTYFLSNYNLPDTNIYKEVFSNQYETASIIVEDQSTLSTNVFTYDINKNYISTTTFTGLIAYNYRLYNLGVGPQNLIVSGVDLTNVVYYDVNLYNVCGMYATIKRKIVVNCSPFNNIRIMFLNRLGGFDYYNFNYDSKYSVNITRQEFNRTLPWNYNVGDRGRSVLTIDADAHYVANTDYISQYDYNFLQELSTSPNVYVIDETNNVKLPIIIMDATWDQKTVLREKIFSMTLTYKYAYNISLQSF